MNSRLLITLMLVLLTGCYRPISGTVVDADTNAPIDGAVVMVEWTMTHGIGNYSTESYKVAETQTDKDGKFTLPGCYRPFVQEPDVTIYKRGYVTWSSRNIFPSWENRKDFKWRSGSIYRLEKFKDTYSYTDHESFTSRAINDTIGWESKKIFIKMYDEAEREKIVKEQNKKDMERMRGQRR